jgi:ABC-type multidrug transport system ATPase subunit
MPGRLTREQVGAGIGTHAASTIAGPLSRDKPPDSQEPSRRTAIPAGATSSPHAGRMPAAGAMSATDSCLVEQALVLEHVTRRHAGSSVWAPVDLRLGRGSMCVVTGANGAGKTTLLRLAAGLLRPTSGTRRCSGTALYLHAGSGLRSAQTVAEAVAGTARLVGREQDALSAVARLGLGRLAHRRLGTLSAGERVRASLATALAAAPALLCLDEPNGALDGEGLRLLLGVLHDLGAAGCATVIASHQPAGLLPFADAHLELVNGHLSAP